MVFLLDWRNEQGEQGNGVTVDGRNPAPVDISTVVTGSRHTNQNAFPCYVFHRQKSDETMDIITSDGQNSDQIHLEVTGLGLSKDNIHHYS